MSSIGQIYIYCIKCHSSQLTGVAWPSALLITFRNYSKNYLKNIAANFKSRADTDNYS